MVRATYVAKCNVEDFVKDHTELARARAFETIETFETIPNPALVARIRARDPRSWLEGPHTLE